MGLIRGVRLEICVGIDSVWGGLLLRRAAVWGSH